MANFKCGSVAIATGVTEFTVSSALSFEPVQVLVSVRQPSASAPIVSASVTGSPTSSSFDVALNAPALETGYYLEWTAFSDAASPAVSGDTLSLSYTDLKEIVARYLGWNPASLTSSQTSTVDACIQSGIRQFYYPPAIEGVDPNFEWSFLRQSGTIAITAGTDNYQLPDGFGRLAGSIVIEGAYGPTIPVIPYGELMRKRTTGATGRPRFAAIISEQAFGTCGQAKRIYFFPCPGVDYTASFVCDADAGKLDSTNRPFPLGGPMFAELVKESCLAVAEHDINDAAEIHTQNFQSLLVSMIQRDRKSSAQNFGHVFDTAPLKGVDDPFVALNELY